VDTSVLEIALRGLSEQLDPPPRIVDLFAPSATGVTLLLEPEQGPRSWLVIDVDPARATLHMRPAAHSRDGSPFAQRILGGYLLTASHGADAESEPRVVRLVARKPMEADPAARDWSLVIEWTGRSGNVRLVNGNEIVHDALRPHGPQGGDRYTPPPPDPRPALDAAGPELEELFRSAAPAEWCKRLARYRDVSRALAWDAIWTGLRLDPDAIADPSSDPLEIVTERVTRSDFDPVECARRVRDLLRRYSNECGATHENEVAGRLFLYRTPRNLQPLLPAAIVSARPLASLESCRVRNAPADPMAVLAGSYSILAGAQREEIRRAHYDRRFRTEMQRLRRLREKVAAEAGSAEDESKLRLYGEAILANLRTIKKGDALLRCPDWTRGSDAPPLEIPLDPARPATDSADQYFKRARRAAKSRPIREKRIAKLEEAMAKLSMLESRLRDQSPLPDANAIESSMREALRSFYKEPTSPDPGLRMPGDSGRSGSATSGRSRGADSEAPRQGRAHAGEGGGSRGREAPGRGGRGGGDPERGAKGREDARGDGARFRPREFTIRDGWKVIVGRSNEENDHVTHRLAKQEDYWFHASGVPGSHVVLKRAGRKDNPSSKAIEEAAAIAAFYSKARNSRKAPVIYTLKKYVHKPRKAKPGLATCTNEKTVMVTPKNPEEGITPEWIAED